MEQKGNEQYRDALLKKLKDDQERIKKSKEKLGGKYEKLDSTPKRHERRTIWTESFPLDHKKLKSLVECLIESGYRITEIRTTVTEEPIGVEVRSFIHESIDCYIAHAKYYISPFDDIIFDDKKYTTVIGLVNRNVVGIMIDTDESTLNVMIRSENDSLPKNEDVEKAKSLIGYYLHIVDEKPKFETSADMRPMACVYASPEMMSEKSKPIFDNQTYPYIHAVQDVSKDKNMMGDVYGSPQMMDDMMPMVAVYASPEMMDGDWKLGGFTETQTKSNKSNKTKFCEHCGKRVDSSWSFCSSCGSAIGMADPEVTIQFCTKCGRENPLGGRYCVYCGNEMGLIQSRDECDAPMACVYASPERMSVTDQKKESFIKRLFRRKNK